MERQSENELSLSSDPVNANVTPLPVMCPGSLGDQVTGWREIKASHFHKSNRLVTVWKI